MSIEKKISRYPVPEISEMPEDIREVCEASREKLGFVPNVLTALAHRPDELRAFLAYNNAVMNKESGLTPAEKELLIVAFSSMNGCTYCVQSHSAAYRLSTEGNKNAADQVAVNYFEADISPREKAMIEFGVKLTVESKAVVEEDFEALRKHGFSDDDIWDIAGITAFFNLSNRMMTFLAVRPDEEFYGLGRG